MKSDYPQVDRTYLFKNSKGVYYAITGTEGDDEADIMDDCICEIDELIASSVVDLCNKGYVTKYSCSGHAFGKVAAEAIEEEYTEGKYEHVIEVKDSDSIGATMVCIQAPTDNIAYISFEEGICLPSIPNDWYFKNNSINYDIDSTGTPIDYYKSVLLGLEKLQLWINELPDLNNYL